MSKHGHDEAIIAYTYGYKTQMILPRNPTLTSAQADEPCNQYDFKDLLQILNNLTGYNFDFDEPNLETGLQVLKSGNHDVGKAYAWFRTAFAFTFNGSRTRVKGCPNFVPVLIAWYSGLPDVSNCEPSLTTVLKPGIDAVDQGETVIQPVDGDLRIMHPDRSHPRRLWDLLANRVIPYEWHARTTRVFGLNMPKTKTQTGVHIIPGTQFPNPDPLPPAFAEFRAGYIDRASGWSFYGFQSCVPYTAISHSWAAKLRHDLSPVNKGMWPIPLPDDITLEYIRQDLLSFIFPEDRLRRPTFWQVYSPPHEVEYCWLDILCLRQAWTTSTGTPLTAPPTDLDYRQLENTRLQEWKLDVPIIGSIYQRASDILIYMNGLGKPMSFTEKDWESPYHWMNRAWTLQEYQRSEGGASKYGIVMRGTAEEAPSPRLPSSGLNALLFDLPFLKSLYTSGRLPPHQQISYGCDIIRIIKNIVQRHASNEVDRIAGLLFLLNCQGVVPQLPIYKPGEALESAWERTFRSFLNYWKIEFSIFAPQPPDQLFPAWNGLKSVLTNGPQFATWLTTAWEIDSDFWLNRSHDDPKYTKALVNASLTLPLWDMELPGSFDLSSNVPLRQAEPIVGLRPLKCRLEMTTNGERKLHILSDSTRGINQNHSLEVHRWYLSSSVTTSINNNDAIYYIIPHLKAALWPMYYADDRHSSDFLEELAFESTIPFFFLVCDPLPPAGCASSPWQWDGITYKKLGFIGLLPESFVPKGVDTTQLQENKMFRRNLPFWRLFDDAYPPSLIPLIEDIPYLTPTAVQQKYGAQNLYSLIY